MRDHGATRTPDVHATPTRPSSGLATRMTGTSSASMVVRRSVCASAPRQMAMRPAWVMLLDTAVYRFRARDAPTLSMYLRRCGGRRRRGGREVGEEAGGGGGVGPGFMIKPDSL